MSSPYNDWDIYKNNDYFYTYEYDNSCSDIDDSDTVDFFINSLDIDDLNNNNSVSGQIPFYSVKESLVFSISGSPTRSVTRFGNIWKFQATNSLTK